MMIELGPIITAVFAGVAYSLYWYVNKVADPSSPTTWKDIDPYPVVATAVVGAAVGGFMFVSGMELTQVSFEAQFLAYGALVAVVERGVRTVVRILKARGVV